MVREDSDGSNAMKGLPFGLWKAREKAKIKESKWTWKYLRAPIIEHTMKQQMIRKYCHGHRSQMIYISAVRTSDGIDIDIALSHRS